MSGGWLSMTSVRNKKYVKLSMNEDVNKILKVLADRKKQLEVT
jgi:hypothetical protein